MSLTPHKDTKFDSGSVWSESSARESARKHNQSLAQVGGRSSLLLRRRLVVVED